MADEMVFVVDLYIDQIRKKKLRDLVKKQKWNSDWGRKNEPVFETEIGAQDYLLSRAEDRITHAKVELRQAEVKLIKMQRKFNRN